jgi:hypothetical protein
MKGLGRRFGGSSRGRRAVPLVALAVLLATVAVTVAAADEGPSRAEYVGELEGICKPRAEATQEAMRGAKADLKAERLAVAASKFAKATTIFGGTLAKMSSVPQPPADTAKLATWFGYLDRQESYLKQITAQLRAGRAIPAQRLTARFIHNGNLANNSVIAFGFNYCSFKFSRYG